MDYPDRVDIEDILVTYYQELADGERENAITAIEVLLSYAYEAGRTDEWYSSFDRP